MPFVTYYYLHRPMFSLLGALKWKANLIYIDEGVLIVKLYHKIMYND